MALSQNEPLSLSSTTSPTPVSAPTTSGVDISGTRSTTVNPQAGTSIIAPNPVDTIPRPTPTTVASPTPTPVVSGVLVDAYTSRPIVVATPMVVSDTVKSLAGEPLSRTSGGIGGGGGGGVASSEESGDAQEAVATEQPKKPNYLVLGLLGLGAYLIIKKVL